MPSFAPPVPSLRSSAVSEPRSWPLPSALSLEIGFAVLLFGLLCGPKLATIDFVNDFLWGHIGATDAALVLAQDLLLWWACLGLVHWLFPRVSVRGLAIVWVLLGALSLLLFLDMRVRQMWLKPLDLAVVTYFFEELPSLRSSSGLFFAAQAGLGWSFRAWLAVAALVHASLGLVMLGLHASHRDRGQRHAGRWATATWCTGAALGLTLAFASPRHSYALQNNLLLGPAMQAFVAPPPPPPPVRFEQAARPTALVLAEPRVRLQEVEPFRNLVVVVLESFRYREFALEGAPVMPNLRRFASQGLAAKTYVSVPHSSKAIYTILSGRAPSSTVEIREAVPFEQESIIRELRQRGVRTWAFSAAFLGFENTDGLLRSLGLDHRIGPDPLRRRSHRARLAASYGIDDVALVDVPATTLAEQSDGPFACVLLTASSHHPYLFPGKRPTDGDRLASYRRSLHYTDQVLGEIVAEFEAAGLADDTLFVFVGDHGESFGEHGSYVHNNSLYEEEITVPLVLWSSDGRLRHAEPLRARQIDIAPTIADLMGLRDPEFETQGVSLLREVASPPAFVASFFDDVAQALVTDDRKYMFWPSSDRLERFDLRTDPHERHPIVVEGHERGAVLDRLRAQTAYERRVFAEIQGGDAG